MVPFMKAGSEDEAVEAARKIGYPVVVKMNSPDITHKSDVGGVILGVADEAGVRKAFRGVSAAAKTAGARDEGVIVCAMAAPGREVIVGVVRDLQFGPAVMFGMGGVLVEALGDVSVRVVPLSHRDAEEMIAGIRGSMLLKGYRGGKPVDTVSIRDLLLKVSGFAEANPDVAELDLHPVIVHEKGLSIVDARVIPTQGAG